MAFDGPDRRIGGRRNGAAASGGPDRGRRIGGAGSGGPDVAVEKGDSGVGSFGAGPTKP